MHADKFLSLKVFSQPVEHAHTRNVGPLEHLSSDVLVWALLPHIQEKCRQGSASAGDASDLLS